MEYLLEGCQPAAVWHYFEEISAIPRRSGQERAVSEYLCRFAAAHGLEHWRDEWNNVVIKKAGSKGCETQPAVMLQGHQDMVCEKNADVVHDFETDGISLEIRGGYLCAKGTTLGADNGIAVAMMLAVLADGSLIHPPLECVFTVQEEVGLIGAANLDVSRLSAKTMINLDSEEEGIATVSCAGGLRAELSRRLSTEPAKEAYGCRITLGGLPGGHSGTDIGAGRTNANKLMGRILNHLLLKTEFRLARLSGGSKDNAIPRECDALLVFAGKEKREAAFDCLQEYADMLKRELLPGEPGFFCRWEAADPEETAADAEETCGLVQLLTLAPNGVQSRNVRQGGFIVSSVNLGVVRLEGGEARLVFAPRSSVASLQEEMKERLLALGRAFGYSVVFAGEYPGWEYAEHSPVRALCCRVYRELTDKELKTEAIHAGLECGLFCQKLPGLDAIAIGPNMLDVHTPEERLEIASVTRTYALVCRLLEALAKEEKQKR